MDAKESTLTRPINVRWRAEDNVVIGADEVRFEG